MTASARDPIGGVAFGRFDPPPAAFIPTAVGAEHGQVGPSQAVPV